MKTSQNTRRPPRRRFGAGVALLSAAALAACGGSDSEATAAEQVASDYVQAVSDYNIAGVRAVVAAGADINGARAYDLIADVAWAKAAGYSITLDSCHQQPEPSQHRVICTYDFHMLGSDEMGMGPYSGNRFELTVSDGQVARAQEQMSVVPNGFTSEVWEPFADWVRQAHPQDFAVMYTDASGSEGRKTAAALALWEERTTQYPQLQNAQAQMSLQGIAPPPAALRDQRTADRTIAAALAAQGITLPPAASSQVRMAMLNAEAQLALQGLPPLPAGFAEQRLAQLAQQGSTGAPATASGLRGADSEAAAGRSLQGIAQPPAGLREQRMAEVEAAAGRSLQGIAQPPAALREQRLADLEAAARLALQGISQPPDGSSEYRTSQLNAAAQLRLQGIAQPPDGFREQRLAELSQR